MTVVDAAARLSMSPSFVRRLIARGVLPCYRLGRAVRLDENDVEAYWRAMRCEASEPTPTARMAAPSWAEIDARLRAARPTSTRPGSSRRA
jgi:excisionase family DNA binding protein